MSRIIVTNNAQTVFAELAQDEDGNWGAMCEVGDWESQLGRWYNLRDLAEEAGIHMDQAHR